MNAFLGLLALPWKLISWTPFWAGRVNTWRIFNDANSESRWLRAGGPGSRKASPFLNSLEFSGIFDPPEFAVVKNCAQRNVHKRFSPGQTRRPRAVNLALARAGWRMKASDSEIAEFPRHYRQSDRRQATYRGLPAFADADLSAVTL